MDGTAGSVPVNNEPEDWRWIPGYENLYSISTLGRVYSYRKECYLRAWTTRNAHDDGNVFFAAPRVYISVGGHERSLSVHLVLLRAFRGSCPSGHHACWLDGNSSNNCLANLVWAPNAYPARCLSARHTRVVTSPSVGGAVVACATNRKDGRHGV